MKKSIVRIPKTAPAFLAPILLQHEAWLVGGAARWVLAGGKGELPKDWDVIVPPKNWLAASQLLPKDRDITLNRFGGICVVADHYDDPAVDIWPAHLEDYFKITQKHIENVAVRFNPLAVIREGF